MEGSNEMEMDMEEQTEFATPPVERDTEVTEIEQTTSAGVRDAGGESVEHPEASAEPETIQLDLGPLITLVVGLALGFLAGFVGRPYLMSQSQPSVALSQEDASVQARTQAPAAATPASAAQSAAPTSASASSSNAATDDTAAREAAAQQLMDALIAQTRHFKGDPDAPVTMIEFSDFQ